MSSSTYVKAQRVILAKHPTLSERWVQDQIKADPSLLGLGELEVHSVERSQPRAGRLDMLLKDPETYRRYTVELQLGATDETHIIRSLEYWDIERKRYPQYDHCAVLVAEDVTSRFLNVISLFNGTVPFVAIQMAAYQVGDALTLTFAKVLDEMRRGFEEEDDSDGAEAVDRAFWEAKGDPGTVVLADKVLALVREFDGKLESRYNKHYIGFVRDGQAFNFAVCRPRKKDVLRLDVRLERSEERSAQLEQAGLTVADYDSRWGAYRLNLKASDLAKHSDLLRELLKEAYDARAE